MRPATVSTLRPDAGRAEAAFWATFVRNRNVDATTAADGAIPVAGGYAVCVAGTLITLVLGAGTTRALNADDLATVAGFYGARGLPARFELDAAVLERDGALLRGAGYGEDGDALAVYEGELPASGDGPGGGIAVRTTADRRAWTALAARAAALAGPNAANGSLPSGVAASGPLRRTLHADADAAHLLVVASLGGADAGAAALAVSGDVALLFAASVLPEFRKRGVYAALVASRLSLGAARGATQATLTAPAGSPAERSARRCGLIRTAIRQRLRTEAG